VPIGFSPHSGRLRNARGRWGTLDIGVNCRATVARKDTRASPPRGQSRSSWGAYYQVEFGQVDLLKRGTCSAPAVCARFASFERFRV